MIVFNNNNKQIRGTYMPVISMFYGIIIQLFFFDTDKHNKPHIHARYAEYNASIDIETAEILEGELPKKQLRLVQAWIELHKEELMADWLLAVNGNPPYKIEPLK
jgi:hypothetical protein